MRDSRKSQEHDSLLHRMQELECRNAQLERQHAIHLAITRTMAESGADPIPKLVQSITESIGWDFGEIWRIDHQHNALVQLSNWRNPFLPLRQFEEVSRQITFAPGLGLPGRIWATTRPAWIPNVVEDSNFPRASFAAKDGLYGGFGFPIRAAGKVIGVMSFFSRAVHSPDTDLLQMLDQLGAAIGVFMANQQNENVAQAQIQAIANERQQIATRLYQQTVQPLFSANLIAETLPYLWESNLNKLWQNLGELREFMRTSLLQSHSLLNDLGAKSYAEADAETLLRELITKFTLQSRQNIALNVKGECHLATDAQIAIYCIVQEALQNIVNHARAAHVTVNLFSSSEGHELSISDNGRGFDPSRVLPDRIGLRIMRECAERIGAEFQLSTQINKGTQITVRWRKLL